MDWFFSWFASLFSETKPSTEDKVNREIKNKSESICLALEVLNQSEQHIASLRKSVASSENDIAVLQVRIRNAENDESAMSLTKRLLQEEKECNRKNVMLGEALLSYSKAKEQVSAAQAELMLIKQNHQTKAVQKQLAEQRVATNVEIDLTDLEIKAAAAERVADLDIQEPELYDTEVAERMKQLRG